MKKSIGVGIGLVVIVIIGIVYSSVISEEDLVIGDQSSMNESVSNEEEIIVDEPQTSGREISVEFSESIELESP